MANKFLNLVYDPSTEGFDTSIWRLVYGSAAVAGGELALNHALIIHYGDIVRGDARFTMNMAKPGAGDNTSFGLMQYNKNAYISFNVIDGVLYASISDGVNTDSIEIDWNSIWTSVDTEFRIKWEAGTASFFIGGILRAAINSVSVTGSPLSLFVMSDNDGDTVSLVGIIVRGIQGYVFSSGNADSKFEPSTKVVANIHVSELVSAVTIGTSANKVDNLNISEFVTVIRPDLVWDLDTFVDSVSVSDVIENIEVV